MVALICDEHQRERLFRLLCAFDEAFIHQSRRMGAAGFWVKPVSDDTVKKTAGRLLVKAEGATPRRDECG